MRSIAWMEESCLRNSNHFILWKVFSFGRLLFFGRLLYQNYLHNTSSRIIFGITTTYIFQNWIATRNLKGTNQVFYWDVFSSPKVPAIRKVLFLKERFIKLHLTKIYRAPTRKSTLNIHCKDWCWSWSSNTLAIWWELTHCKRLWCWEGLRAGGEVGDRGWDGWMALPIQWAWVWANSRR